MNRTIQVILRPLQHLASQKPNASILLFMATLLAMLLANSTLADAYHNILAYPVDLGRFNYVYVSICQ